MTDRLTPWVGDDDEPVEVNQRALIDKVLARYSGKFTVFRELLQNADDAEATAVQIIFETKSTAEISEGTEEVRPPPNLDDIVLWQWVVKNNGMLFRDEDWSRLKKIADGNPDDKKIGAFGVGFYSLFSITEAPLVTSGTKRMGFYWRDGKNQLFVHRESLPETAEPISPWTTFTLPLRQIGPPPGSPLELLRFLASSIVFMNNLSTVELFLDGTRLGKISKEVGLPQRISIPKTLVDSQQPVDQSPDGRTSGGKDAGWNWATPKKYFIVTNVNSTPVRVCAEVIEWVYPTGFPEPRTMANIGSPLPLPPPSPPETNMNGSPVGVDDQNDGSEDKTAGVADTSNVPPSVEVPPTVQNSTKKSFLSSFKSSTKRGTLSFFKKKKKPSVDESTRTEPAPAPEPEPELVPVPAPVVEKVEEVVMEVVEEVNEVKGVVTEEAEKVVEKVEGTGEAGVMEPATDQGKGVEIAEEKKLPAYQGKEVTTSILLSVFTAEADVKLDEEMDAELERATKKRAPPHVKVSLIYTGKEAYDASEGEEMEDSDRSKDSGSVFLGLRADIHGNNTSRVYIGHATGQTTGISGHISARFIPTVERESIDLVDRNVSVWNIELLHICGYLSRVVYETELSDIARLYAEALRLPRSELTEGDADPAEQIHIQLQSRFLHALQFFTFLPSTPSPEVSNIIQSTFFAASDTFNVLSTVGVKPSTEVRVWNSETARFIRMVAVLPPNIQAGAIKMVRVLQSRKMMTSMSFDDVIWELKHRCLEEEEMMECLKWMCGLPKELTSESRFKKQFIGLGAFMVRGKEGTTEPKERLVRLSTISTFFSPSGFVPVHGPFPTSTLPSKFSITKGFPVASLRELFGWNQFTLNDWIVFLTSTPPEGAHPPEHGITRSLDFAEKVLTAIAKGWTSLSEANQKDLVRRLRHLQCVPTQLGLKYPRDAYLPSVDLFSDLPIATFLSTGALTGKLKGATEAVLRSLGVRKHVDLHLVFDRMVKTGDWTVPQLVRYLMGIRDQMPPDELETLQQMAAFPDEERQKEKTRAADQARDELASGTTATTSRSPLKPRTRHRIDALYEPSDSMRNLGLTVLDWGDSPRWRTYSDEAKFLFSIGLQRFPPLREILRLAASEDANVRKLALKYFLEKFSTQYRDYTPDKFGDIAFIPAIDPNGKEFLAKHSQVFLESGCQLLGLAVIRSDLKDDAQTKLKLAKYPSGGAATSAVIRDPPTTEEKAKRLFEYLTNFLGDFDPGSLLQLKVSKIIPTASSKLVKPCECYFKSEVQANLRSKLFTFVDFGARANTFLRTCGVRNAPTPEDLALTLIADPDEFYGLAGGPEGFKVELKYLAANFDYITPSTKQKMKRSPILLGVQRIEEKDTEKDAGVDSSDSTKDGDTVNVSYQLLRADQIVIIDDANLYAEFSDILYGAPQEDTLESFYSSLGSPRLGQLVKEEYKPKGEMRDSPEAIKIRKLVLERLPLFLHRMLASQIRIRPEWMQNSRNFVVKKVGRLVLQKTLVFCGRRAVKDSEASAAAKRETLSNTLVLYIAHNIPLDLYESLAAECALVANSLCKYIISTPKENDSAAFTLILSTDLATLRRRGYNVDRILNQRKIEREAAAKSAKAGGSAWPNTRTREEAIMDSILQMLDSLDDGNDSKPYTDLLKDLLFFGSGGKHPLGWMQSSSSGAGNGQPTPESDIEKRVKQAINACRPEARNRLQNREGIDFIKESRKECYCDIAGREGDLVRIGAVDNVRIYAGKDVQDPEGLLLKTKSKTIDRFISILRPLKKVYKLPDESLHIFYDLEGSTIAFNSDGALFLNLRYFESWHDTQVKQGELIKAMMAWFFTLSHEIAHNLIGSHSAEHSRFMNEISQAHLLALFDELQLVRFAHITC